MPLNVVILVINNVKPIVFHRFHAIICFFVKMIILLSPPSLSPCFDILIIIYFYIVFSLIRTCRTKIEHREYKKGEEWSISTL